jgi:tripartite ATP-independent transporter DctM subunit
VETRSFLEASEDFCRRVTRPIAFIGVFGMLVVAGVTVCDVLLRWLFNTPLPALVEIVSVTFAVAISACMASGAATGVNIKVDLLSRRLTGRLASWLDVFGALLLFAFFAVLAWQISLFAGQLAAQGRGTMMLGIPLAPFIYGASFLLGVTAMVQLVMVLGELRHAMGQRGNEAGGARPIATLVVVMLAAVLIASGVYVAFSFEVATAWARAHLGLTVVGAFILMWILMLGFVPLAAVMGLTGLIGAALLIGFPSALSAFATEAAGFLTNSQVATLPLFLMMGSFAAQAGLAADLYNLAQVLLGRFRGGLGYATVAGCAGFGALTSSSIATASLIGKVAIPEMRGRGYSSAFSTGCVAAGGTLGALVPPSSPLIVFALLTEASVGRLFLAALGPALLAVALYFGTIWLVVRLSPKSIPPTGGHAYAELAAAFWQCRTVGLVFALVMGGLYLGVFTDTEAAAVGAFSCFVIALLRGKLGGGRFWTVMAETTAVTAMIYALIFGANIFSFFVAVSSLSGNVAAFFADLNWVPWAVIAILLAGYVVLGSIMESFAVMVITVPIVTPMVLDLGYDLVWWGVMLLCMVETGLITPPLGLNVFVLKSMTPDVPIWTTYKGVLPFVVADLVKASSLVAFPGISLWLVNIMMP